MVSCPRYVIADVEWYLTKTNTTNDKEIIVNTIRGNWSKDMEAAWEPSIVFDMNEWLDDYCIVKKWRQRQYETWVKHCSYMGPHAFHTRGISPCRIPTTAPRYSVLVKGFDTFTDEGELLFTMSAIIGDGEVAAMIVPKTHSGSAIVEYLSEKDRDRALNWSKRISLGGNVLTIEEHA